MGRGDCAFLLPFQRKKSRAPSLTNGCYEFCRRRFFYKTGPFPRSREVQKLTANQNLRRRSIFEKKEIAVKTILIALQ